MNEHGHKPYTGCGDSGDTGGPSNDSSSDS